MKFFAKKFLKLSSDIQIKRIYKFLSEIELKWSDEKIRSELISNLFECIDWIKYQNSLDKEIIISLSSLTKVSSLDEYIAVVVFFEQLLGINKRDDQLIIYQQDGKRPISSSIPLNLILLNIRSSYNVGAIFRTGECLGVKKIYLCGYTPTPQNDRTSRTAMGTDQLVEWELIKDPLRLLKELRDREVNIYALETAQRAQLYNQINYPQQECALVLGNETLGVPAQILNAVDELIQIPVYGWKNSLNVGIAAGICAYEIRRQWDAGNFPK